MAAEERQAKPREGEKQTNTYTNYCQNKLYVSDTS